MSEYEGPDRRRDPTVDSLIIEKINMVEGNLSRRLDDQNRELSRRLDEQDRTLHDIQEQTRRTNGRVTALEAARERGMGVLAAYKWVPVVLAGALSAGLALLGTALAGGFH